MARAARALAGRYTGASKRAARRAKGYTGSATMLWSPYFLTGDARLEFLRNSGPAPEMKMERAGQ